MCLPVFNGIFGYSVAAMSDCLSAGVFTTVAPRAAGARARFRFLSASLPATGELVHCWAEPVHLSAVFPRLFLSLLILHIVPKNMADPNPC